jgi:hypothetical protein
MLIGYGRGTRSETAIGISRDSFEDAALRIANTPLGGRFGEISSNDNRQNVLA